MVKQWEIRILPNKRTLFVHNHDWHAQLYVSAYNRGIVNAQLLGRDTIEGFVRSAVTALTCPDFEHLIKIRYLALRRIKGIRLNFGFTTLLVTKEWLENTANPAEAILKAAQNTSTEALSADT